MQATIFSKIVNGDLPCYKVYEDDEVLAFLDISQLTKGHTIVIPKIATLSMLEASDAINDKVFSVATKLAKKIVNTFQASGCNILTNAHEAAGQEVMHFHVHIIPRYASESLVISIHKSNKEKSCDLQAIQNELQQ
ncbi:MAG: HIT family protein [Culicoidibacterales bacterium]